MTKSIGYLRISTQEQRPDRQIIGLQEICDELHVEALSAVSKNRPIFDQVISKLETGDRFVVWDFDRAFRSTMDAIQTAELLRERGVVFQVATMKMDTETPMGEFAYTVIAASAHFERRILSKRTKEGMAAARARGVKLGRPRKLSEEQILEARQLIKKERATLKSVALRLGVSPWTVRRSVL